MSVGCFLTKGFKFLVICTLNLDNQFFFYVVVEKKIFDWTLIMHMTSDTTNVKIH